MLQNIETPPINLREYREWIDEGTLTTLERLAARLEGLKVGHVNATSRGGPTTATGSGRSWCFSCGVIATLPARGSIGLVGSMLPLVRHKTSCPLAQAHPSDCTPYGSSEAYFGIRHVPFG